MTGHTNPRPAARGRPRPGRRPRWYQVVYHLIYRLRLAVWQRPAPPAGLVALIEGPEPVPAGRALDLGCGTGTDAIYLAVHGWDVTAVDMVPAALAVARRNAAAAGVSPRFLRGDVTRLPELGIGLGDRHRDRGGDGNRDGGGYSLVLDFGCFHTLPEDRRAAYVAGVTQAAAPDAILLLYGFRRPPKAAPMHAGLTVDEVRRRFIPAGWRLLSAEPAHAETLGVTVPRAGQRFQLWCYQLRRVPSSAPGSV